jgi:plasmid maintenance system antidote protein VapI
MSEQVKIVRAVLLNDQGLSMNAIAEHMGTDRATVRELLNEAPIEWIREPRCMPV